MYQRSMAAVNELEGQFGALWTQCQRCQGSLHQVRMKTVIPGNKVKAPFSSNGSKCSASLPGLPAPGGDLRRHLRHCKARHHTAKEGQPATERIQTALSLAIRLPGGVAEYICAGIGSTRISLAPKAALVTPDTRHSMFGPNVCWGHAATLQQQLQRSAPPAAASLDFDTNLLNVPLLTSCRFLFRAGCAVHVAGLPHLLPPKKGAERPGRGARCAGALWRRRLVKTQKGVGLPGTPANSAPAGQRRVLMYARWRTGGVSLAARRHARAAAGEARGSGTALLAMAGGLPAQVISSERVGLGSGFGCGLCRTQATVQIGSWCGSDTLIKRLHSE